MVPSNVARMTSPTERADADIREVTAGAADAGERLDRLLAAQFADLSRTRLKALIEGGQVTTGGATISDASLRVKPGQSFRIAIPAATPDRPEPQAMDLVIVHEDGHVLVIDKPAGLVVHPAPGNLDHTLVNALLAHCGESLTGIGGVRRPGIVHRIDKDTSGLMVVAKTERAHASLSAAFADHSLTRAYQAVVWGVPLPRTGEIAGRIGRSPRNRKKMAVVPLGGKEALTRYRVLREFSGAAALVECRLATGRTHQIRVHMTDIGHPLIGDQTYGSPRRGGRLSAFPEGTRAMLRDFPRQALHATVIGFDHPATGAYLEFVSTLPNDIQALIHTLESL